MTSLTRRDLAILAAAVAAATTSDTADAQLRSGPGAKYKEILAKDLQGFPLQMTRLTTMDVAPGTQIPWHYHPAAQEIVFGLEGVITFEVDPPAIRTIKAGDVLLIPAGTLHKPRPDASSPARVLFIHSITDKTKPFLLELEGVYGPE
ncbi:MAG: cupin domain-containing protein [Rhodomicrobium sp.]